jgi:hypothetical protein
MYRDRHLDPVRACDLGGPFLGVGSGSGFVIEVGTVVLSRLVLSFISACRVVAAGRPARRWAT